MTQEKNIPCDLLLFGMVLTMDGENTIITDGAVAVSGERIAAVGSASDLRKQYGAKVTLAAPAKGLIMPGLVNVHTHAAMSCMRGLADDLPLMTWLREHIFPVEGRLTGEMVHDASLLSMVEMIKSGTTSFCDMYLFADHVARAADKSGMRAWVGEVLYDFPSPCYGELAAGFAHVEKMVHDYHHHPLITITMDPHSVYTCAPELLVALKEKAVRHDCPYVIHLSENEDEVKTVMARYGKTPVNHLESLGLLDERVIADHCVVLTADEIKLLAARKVKVAHCPESNMKLASGVAPVPELLAAGVDVGLGTDGSASNNDVDLFAEMDVTAKLHKVHRLDPTVMTARETLFMATMGGARVLGAQGEIGSLEPGKKADIIVLDLEKPHLTPLYNVPSQLVYAARGSDVIHSVINGKIVMRDRKMTGLDEKEIMGRVNEMTARLSG
ncbi:MAG: amidohydrolase [Deltaproteobacteria bacterium]|nr:amidohydrolase [Deltaproteobacteria bacterium]